MAYDCTSPPCFISSQVSSTIAQDPIFPPELNDEWEDILWRLDLILSPFKQAFKAALPDPGENEQKPKVCAYDESILAA
jgi:hypothetical protein